ncbi:hypothetical protein L208DRAFT_1416811 [Tricholoma matsutake]|nr:hypothetical protein L208DRAFT_1416811 [Tricholoma matsutake 945]
MKRGVTSASLALPSVCEYVRKLVGLTLTESHTAPKYATKGKRKCRRKIESVTKGLRRGEVGSDGQFPEGLARFFKLGRTG